MITAPGSEVFVIHRLSFGGRAMSWFAGSVDAEASASLALQVPWDERMPLSMLDHTLLLQTRLESFAGIHSLDPIGLRLERLEDGRMQARVLPTVHFEENRSGDVYNATHTVVRYDAELMRKVPEVVVDVFAQVGAP
jgi:hypothetical protein